MANSGFFKTAKRHPDGKVIASHGQGNSGAMVSYCNAKRRCTCPNYSNYHRYGGRGIEFRFKSFTEFYELMGDRPVNGTLDRIDNDGHYEIGNVRWATRRVQTANRAVSVNYWRYLSEC